MKTTSFPILANTVTSLLVGNIRIRSIRVSAATPGTFSFYDAATAVKAWSAPGYTAPAITSGQTAVVTEAACCGGIATDITRSGATQANVVTNANGSKALPAIAILTDGCCGTDEGLAVKHGLVVEGTVGATVIVEYATIP